MANNNKAEDLKLKIYTDEEIDIFLVGDRREVDRLILHGLNGLAATLIPHAAHEEDFLRRVNELGGIEAIKKRAAWVDVQIERQAIRNRMMEKVATSNVVWASLAFLGYIAYIAKDSLIHFIQTAAGK